MNMLLHGIGEITGKTAVSPADARKLLQRPTGPLPYLSMRYTRFSA